MNRITLAEEVPNDYQPSSFRIILRRLETAFNALAGGSLIGRLSVAVIPTTGRWTVGDIVYNSAPVAGGTIGWVCVTAGEPGTWKTWGAISA